MRHLIYKHSYPLLMAAILLAVIVNGQSGKPRYQVVNGSFKRLPAENKLIPIPEGSRLLLTDTPTIRLTGTGSGRPIPVDTIRSIIETSFADINLPFYPKKRSVFWYGFGNRDYIRDTVKDLAVKNTTTGKWKLYDKQKTMQAVEKIVDLKNKERDWLIALATYQQYILMQITTEGQIIDRQKFSEMVKLYQSFINNQINQAK